MEQPVSHSLEVQGDAVVSEKQSPRWRRRWTELGSIFAFWTFMAVLSGASGILEWIEWWLQSGWGSEGVHLTDLTEVNAAFNLAGPRSREVLQRLTSRDLSNDKFPYMRVRAASIADVPCRVLRIGFTGELSYEIHCPAGCAQHV